MNLESKPDGYLIKRVQKTNCEESLSILIKRHTPLCYKIYKKYVPSFNVKNIDLNEVYQQKDYVVSSEKKKEYARRAYLKKKEKNMEHII